MDVKVDGSYPFSMESGRSGRAVHDGHAATSSAVSSRSTNVKEVKLPNMVNHRRDRAHNVNVNPPKPQKDVKQLQNRSKIH